MIHIISEVFTKNIFNFFIKIRDGILLASLICWKGGGIVNIILKLLTFIVGFNQCCRVFVIMYFS